MASQTYLLEDYARMQLAINNTKHGQLRTAIWTGNIEQVEQLITEDTALINGPSNIATNAHTPIFTAVSNNNPEILEYLLKEGASVSIQNAQGRTALNLATVNKHLECMRLLLQYGAEVNIKTPDNDYHFTPLHSIATDITCMGCSEAAKACAKLLLQYGADRTIKANNGITAEKITPIITEIARELHSEQSIQTTMPRP